tara:strand:- start:12689 stop:12967 length:279 start_codon:yes stop_codon:yes gene_type:complete
MITYKIEEGTATSDHDIMILDKVNSMIIVFGFALDSMIIRIGQERIEICLWLEKRNKRSLFTVVSKYTGIEGLFHYFNKHEEMLKKNLTRIS